MTPQFDVAWLAGSSQDGTQRAMLADADEWDEIPDGRGNNTLTALAGVLRKQGASYHAILRALLAANKLFMDRDPMPGEMVEQIARSVSRYNPDPDIDIELAEDDEPEVEPEPEADPVALFLDRNFIMTRGLPDPEPPTWLWDPYLPEGKLIALEGQEGIGKGLFATHLAQRVLSGDGFDVSDELREPRPVLWFSAEDDPEDDIYPRMLAAGYDRGIEHAPAYLYRLSSTFELPKMTNMLIKLIERTNPGLLILDPGRVFMVPEDGVERSGNNEASMRPGLQALLRVARETNTTTLFIHHQRKGDGTSRELSIGSNVVRQVCRQVLTAYKVGEHRAFAIDKANHGDSSFTVRSWDVVLREGQSTAQFVLGGKLLEFKTIDGWRKTTEEAEKLLINVSVTTVDLQSKYATVRCGQIAPSVTDIKKDFGVDKETAQRLRAELVSASLIDSHGKWQGCAGGSAEGGTK